MGELSFTGIDVLVVAIVLISAGVAMFRGLVQETFGILEWIGGLYIAFRFSPVFRPVISEVVSPVWLQWVVVFVGTFLLVFIPLSIMSHRISELVKKSEIGPVDRTLGLVFGIARGLVIVGLTYIAFGALVPAKDHPQTLTKARLFPLILSTSDILRSLGPGKDGEPDSEQQAAKSGEQSGDVQAAKTYGAEDRGALDTLFQANGGSSSASR
jgi:membrane protein required for colicin V production